MLCTPMRLIVDRNHVSSLMDIMIMCTRWPTIIYFYFYKTGFAFFISGFCWYIGFSLMLQIYKVCNKLILTILQIFIYNNNFDKLDFFIIFFNICFPVFLIHVWGCHCEEARMKSSRCLPLCVWCVCVCVCVCVRVLPHLCCDAIPQQDFNPMLFPISVQV